MTKENYWPNGKSLPSLVTLLPAEATIMPILLLLNKPFSAGRRFPTLQNQNKYQTFIHALDTPLPKS
jgi:hypothetical protein